MSVYFLRLLLQNNGEKEWDSLIWQNLVNSFDDNSPGVMGHVNAGIHLPWQVHGLEMSRAHRAIAHNHHLSHCGCVSMSPVMLYTCFTSEWTQSICIEPCFVCECGNATVTTPRHIKLATPADRTVVDWWITQSLILQNTGFVRRRGQL